MPLAYRTEAAERDLQDIAFQIAMADGRPATSDRLIDELIAQCNRLAEFAGTATMGTAAPELGDGVRLFTHRRWVIIFRYARRQRQVPRVVGPLAGAVLVGHRTRS